MKTQLLSWQLFQQQPADPKPERITAREHRSCPVGGQRAQALEQKRRLVGSNELWQSLTSPMLQSQMKPARSSNQHHLPQALLERNRQTGRCAGIGADYLDHHAIVTLWAWLEERRATACGAPQGPFLA
jgi:hypothetical protein